MNTAQVLVVFVLCVISYLLIVSAVINIAAAAAAIRSINQSIYVAQRHRVSNALYTVSQKNDTDVTHCRFNPHQPISVIFVRDVAERVCY